MNETQKSIGYFSWKDTLRWMEPMRGPAWEKAVKHQQDLFKQALRPADAGGMVSLLQRELDQRDDEEPTVVHGISYIRTGGNTYRWWEEGAKGSPIECGDLDIRPGKRVWYVQDTETGDERYTLVHWNDKIVWKSKSSSVLGPYVAVLGDWVYGLEAENSLWYCRLVRWKAATGEIREVIYTMKDPQWNLALVKGEQQCLFLLATNAGVQRLWHIHVEKGPEEISGRYVSFVPVGFRDKQDTQDPCFFGRAEGTNLYTPVGRGFTEFKFPSFAGKTPEVCSFSEGLLVTRSYGKRTIWDMKTGRVKQVVVGEVPLDSIQAYAVGKAELTLMPPGHSLGKVNGRAPKAYAQVKYSLAKSRDGTRVPVVYVSSVARAEHVLVIGYGAYGVPTHMGTDRWRPLLRRGWAIAFVLVRGGGDHDDAWAEAARRERKSKSVEDFEAGIRALRRPANEITVYGRSAGGYLIGATLARHANGDLFSNVYTEVPYVDVLSTTSNPSLPLTKLEYNEFGHPRKRPQNAEALLDLSPIQALPAEGAPQISVLCRTALHDKEVFAYESMKWITVLQEAQEGRTGAAPKLLAIADRSGHFGKEGRAEDLAILLFWARGSKKSQQEIYNMASTRRNNMMRKNRKNTRKNRKNTRKNTRKNNMMGGKRRRTNASRKNRKH